jgi:tetratricopeptide (TPR) repeat protein
LATSAGIAFGAYMRLLRQRKKLSIQEVCRILVNASEGTDAGSLSRFERGQQQLAAGKLSALCRVYGVSPEVPLERLDLDQGVEQHAPVDTEDETPARLLDLGREAMERAERWQAYAYYRDALIVGDPEDHALRFNLATAARALGRFRLALHELKVLERDCRGEPLHPSVLERMSSTLRSIGDLDAAERFALSSAEAARTRGDHRTLGFALTSLANVNIARAGDPELTVDYLTMAHRAGRESETVDGGLRPNAHFEVSTLNLLAEAYFDAGREESARRAAAAALKLSEQHGFSVGRAYALLYLGQIDEGNGLAQRAEERWREATSIAESVENKRLRFCAQFYLYRQALAAGETARSRALARGLERLAPWIPENLPLLSEFRRLRSQASAGTEQEREDRPTPARVRTQRRPRATYPPAD